MAAFDSHSVSQNKPTARTPPQEAIFKRGLANMSMWYCSNLTTVYIVRGQDGHIAAPRESKGWPTFEEQSAQSPFERETYDCIACCCPAASC